MQQLIPIIGLVRAFLRHHAALSPSQADRRIRFIGLREGEKLTEQLFFKNETLLRTSYEAMMRIKPSIPDSDDVAKHLKIKNYFR